MEDKNLHDISESEESEVEEDKILFVTLLSRIIRSQPPLSQIQPGYLIGFTKFLENQDRIPAQLENCLPGLIRAAKQWQNATSNRLKKGVIEYLSSVKGLMGTWFEMSFDSRTMQSLKTLLDAYKEMDITEEDCSNYASMETMSTSRMIAHSQTEHADATGGSKRKHSALTLEEIDEDLEDVTQDQEPSPTFKTYSSITVLKDGKYITKKLEDKWKEYMMKVTLYRKKDLLDCQNSRQKWEHRFMEMEINFEKKDVFSQMVNQIKSEHLQNLGEKNVSWAPVKKFRFE
uniref:NS2 n=1 Tax=uncultured densovirus TaxID=748192 RepID=A0A7L7YQF0_9VIRU|nr:NS2 [uncultured densovirus]